MVMRFVLSAGLALIGFALASLSGPAHAGEPAPPRVVTVAVDDAHPPYAYASGGEPVGVYVQMLQLAMRDVEGWQLRLLLRPWARALQESEQGVVDALLPPYANVDRPWMASFIGPLLREDVVLSCSAAVLKAGSRRWPDDFVHRRIGTTRGYLISKELSAGFREQWLSHREYRNARDALAALAAGQIDCYANDLLDIENAHREALASKIWVGRVPTQLEPPVLISSQDAFLGLSQASLARRPELAEFAQLLNARLAQMRAGADVQRLLREAGGGRK